MIENENRVVPTDKPITFLWSIYYNDIYYSLNNERMGLNSLKSFDNYLEILFILTLLSLHTVCKSLMKFYHLKHVVIYEKWQMWLQVMECLLNFSNFTHNWRIFLSEMLYILPEH